MFGFRRSSTYRVVAPVIKQIVANPSVTYNVGDALVISSNKAAKASGTTKPTYICAEKATGKSVISAYPVDALSEYETTVKSGTVEVGKKYTIDTNSAQITSTQTDGVATVTGIAGTRVFVKFE